MKGNVVLKGKLTWEIQITQSLSQGSFLGPWLYMLYIHDLAVHVLGSKIGARFGRLCCGSVLQTDDIALVLLLMGCNILYMVVKNTAMCGPFPIILLSSG